MMTAETEEWGFYSVKSPDGHDLACHAIKGQQPEGATEITADEAKALDDATTARYVPPAAAPVSPVAAQLSASVDLKPIFVEIAALKTTVVKQAGELDKQQAQIQAQADLIIKKDEEARQRTIEALKALAAEVGNKGAA